MPAGAVQVGIGIGPPTDATRPNGLDVAALDGASVVLLDAAGNPLALPSLPRMVLGGFTFAVNPSALNLQEPPLLAMHSPPGGSPRYQWMGRGETRMQLRGKLVGDAALSDMAALRALNGTRQPLSYGPFSAALAWVRVDWPDYVYETEIDYTIQLAVEYAAATGAGGDATTSQPAQAEGQAQTANPAAQDAPTVSYTVVQGDTLFGIAQARYRDGSLFPVIARLNGIDDPSSIQPGQVLQLPSAAAAARALKATQDAELAKLPNDNGTGLSQVLLGAP
jgi:LysM repeat protein